MATAEDCLTKRAAPVPEALTDEQRRFAAARHDLIYTFLRRNDRAVGDYYDIAALGFLSAVKRYLTEPELRQYAFSIIAWRAMESSVASFHRAEVRRRECERRYMQSQPRWQPDPFEELETSLFLHDLAKSSSKEQYALASMRLQGYSIAETAAAQGMSPKRVQRLLKEMYRVYLQLYINS